MYDLPLIVNVIHLVWKQILTRVPSCIILFYGNCDDWEQYTNPHPNVLLSELNGTKIRCRYRSVIKVLPRTRLVWWNLWKWRIATFRGVDSQTCTLYNNRIQDSYIWDPFLSHYAFGGEPKLVVVVEAMICEIMANISRMKDCWICGSWCLWSSAIKEIRRRFPNVRRSGLRGTRGLLKGELWEKFNAGKLFPGFPNVHG